MTKEGLCMIKLYDGGVYLVHGTEIVPEKEIAKVKQAYGKRRFQRRRQEGNQLPILF